MKIILNGIDVELKIEYINRIYSDICFSDSCIELYKIINHEASINNDILSQFDNKLPEIKDFLLTHSLYNRSEMQKTSAFCNKRDFLIYAAYKMYNIMYQNHFFDYPSFYKFNLDSDYKINLAKELIKEIDDQKNIFIHDNCLFFSSSCNLIDKIYDKFFPLIKLNLPNFKL